MDGRGLQNVHSKLKAAYKMRPQLRVYRFSAYESGGTITHGFDIDLKQSACPRVMKINQINLRKYQPYNNDAIIIIDLAKRR